MKFCKSHIAKDSASIERLTNTALYSTTILIGEGVRQHYATARAGTALRPRPDLLAHAAA